MRHLIDPMDLTVEEIDQLLAVGDDLTSALEKAYAAVREITFDGAFYRKDIGARALKALGK